MPATRNPDGTFAQATHDPEAEQLSTEDADGEQRHDGRAATTPGAAQTGTPGNRFQLPPQGTNASTPTIDIERRQQQLLQETVNLERKVDDARRKLFGTQEENSRQIQDRMYQVTDMMTLLDPSLKDAGVEMLSSLERLLSMISVENLQPELGKLDTKARVGTIGQLMAAMEKVVGEDLKGFSKSAMKGGRDLLEQSGKTVTAITIGIGMRPALTAASMMHSLLTGTNEAIAQSMKDMVQSLCWSPVAEWRKILQEAREGHIRTDLLKDKDSSNEEGFKALLPDAKNDQLGDNWSMALACVVSYLAYESVEPLTKMKILARFTKT